jgi:hypothetical protein
MPKVFVSGSVLCDLCGGAVAAGNPGWHGSDRGRCLRKHKQRCETASDEDREYFRVHGSWRKVKRRRAS